MIFSTNKVPIIDINGKVLEQIILPELIKPVPRRRCGYSEKGLYYKGAGIVYTGHFVNELTDGMKMVKETGMMYEKYNVIYPGLYRKYGIFQFNHQPCFSDFEGGCGKKEQNILYIQQHFLYSAIEQIIDVIPVPIENHSIYVYRMKELKGNYMDTIRLIEYVLSENYNTAWDKNVWDDIECFGYLRDLADWFVSDKFCHKLGTAYAFLSALAKTDKYTYERVVRDMTGLEQLGDHHIIYIAALIGKKYAADVDSEMDFSRPSSILYTYLWQQLYSGKACCHLEQEEKFGYVREKYLESVSRNVQLVMHDYLYHSIMIKSSMKNEKRN